MSEIGPFQEPNDENHWGEVAEMGRGCSVHVSRDPRPIVLLLASEQVLSLDPLSFFQLNDKTFLPRLKD